MKPTIFAILIIAALAFVALFLFLNFQFRKRVSKVSSPPPQNRRERRAAEQKHEQYLQRLSKVTEEYRVKYSKYLDELEVVYRAAISNGSSLTRLANELLNVVDAFIWNYQKDVRKTSLTERFIPAAYFIATRDMMKLLNQYYTQHTTTSLQSITTELARFTERHFLDRSLSEVLSRHKGTVTFNDRNEALSAAIITFFTTGTRHNLGGGRMLPADFLNETELHSPEVVQSHFNRVAIEGEYMPAMETAVRNEEFEKREASNRQLHQNNRGQRAKRLKRQARRR